ncbi:major facilitator superfamily domain-containing protein [Mycena galericulata]|nr:major facilitator superfamily domain-containing protein [Mycena galericulata]
MASELTHSSPEPELHIQQNDPEKAPSLASVEFELPEGGREAWLTMAGAWMVQFCTFGYINAFGVYQDYYTREFLTNKTAADISWIGSFQLAIQYAMGVGVGRAVDAGYFHHMMIFGSTLYVLCIFLLSLTHAGQFYQVFLAQAVGMGIFPALIFLPSFTIVSHHFKRRRALAMGIVTSGAACGGVVFPILLNQLGQHVTFTTAIRASGGLIGALLMFANLTMRTRLPSKTLDTKPTEQQQVEEALDWNGMFTDVGYISALIGAFFTSLGLFFPFFYLQLYAVTNGVDKQLAFYLLTLLNGGSVIGRLVNNSISPRIGSFNLVVSSLYACAILIFAMLQIKTFAGLAVFAVLYGYTSGCYASLMPTNFVSFSNSPKEFGVRLGIAFTVVAPAMLVGNPISGALLGADSTHFTWAPIIIYNAVMIAVGATFILGARILYIKRKGKGQWV